MIRVIIKGTSVEAREAAQRRGVALTVIATQKGPSVTGHIPSEMEEYNA